MMLAEGKEVDVKTRWNELHTIQNFSPRYPSEHVIRWTFRNFLREKSSEFNLLDIGAGAGRHAIFWAREGYHAYATDISPLAVSQLLQSVCHEQLVAHAQVAEADALPFDDEAFDGVLSFGVLYYLPYVQMRQSVDEMWRVLKYGGKAFVMIKSADDSRSSGAEYLGQFAYRVPAPLGGASWGRETGMALTLLDMEEVKKLFKRFSEVVVNRTSVTNCNGKFVDDEWLIEIRK